MFEASVRGQLAPLTSGLQYGGILSWDREAEPNCPFMTGQKERKGPHPALHSTIPFKGSPHDRDLPVYPTS